MGTTGFVPVDVPTGWVCPRCDSIYAPRVERCVLCSPRPQLFTGLLPKTKAEAWESSPMFGPLSPIHPVPVDEPGERPEPRPFPHPAGTGLHPVHIEGMRCQPSREGGMCGCGEPGEDTRLLLHLPDYMAVEGCVQMAKVGRDWAEVFPGMQACLSFLRTDEDGTFADIHFRLTPEDGP